MANVNAPSGLAPVQFHNGNPWNGAGRMYIIPQADTNAIAVGDPVATSSGNADTVLGIPAVTLATAGSGNAIRGVVLAIGTNADGGPFIDPRNLTLTVAPATKTVPYYALICDDPDVIFEVQDIGTSTALASTDISKNINLKSGTNNGFVSGWGIDNGSKGTGSTLQCHLFGLARRIDNAFGANAKFLVLINNHELGAGVAGV
jgi:hypothetical protein